MWPLAACCRDSLDGGCSPSARALEETLSRAQTRPKLKLTHWKGPVLLSHSECPSSQKLLRPSLS